MMPSAKNVADHKSGCWLQNGGPQCTCNRRSTGTRTGKFQTKMPNRSAMPSGMAQIANRKNVHGKGDDMLNRLMNFDARGGIMLEDAMVLAAFARQLAGEYETLKVDKPQGFDEKVDDVRRFVADTQRADRKRQLAELKARRTQFLTANEKRELLDKQIAELEALSQ